MPEEPAPIDRFGADRPAGDGGGDGGGDRAGGGPLAAAVARARELHRAGHPDAPGAWAHVRAVAAEADVDDLLAGELAQAQGLARGEAGDWAAAVSGLHAAAAHFELAGRPGRAAAAAAWGAWAAAQPDPGADIWPDLDAQLGRVRELLAAGQAEPADLLTVRHARGAAAALAVQRAAAGASPGEAAASQPGAGAETSGTPAPGTAAANAADPGTAGPGAADPGTAGPGAAAPGSAGPGVDLAGRLDEEARALLADARAYDNPAREAAAMSLLAFAASAAGQPADEAASLSRMAELLDAAGQPWAAAAPVTRLGELALRQGEPTEAVAWLERAVAITAQWPPRGGPAAAAPLLLGYARAALGASLVAAGRGAEAVTVLTEAVPALGETEAAARARFDLGRALRQAGDPASAAEQLALASAAFRAGPDQGAHLVASLEAARALAEARQWPEAQRAYEDARRLGTELGQWAEVILVHRELAHVCIGEHGDTGLLAALTQFDLALKVAAQAAAAGGPGVPHERGIVSYEAAQVLAHVGHFDEALTWLDRAISDLSADDRDIETLADAAYFAADIEGNRLGRGGPARQRLAPVIERCARLDRAQSLAALTELSAQLAS